MAAIIVIRLTHGATKNILAFLSASSPSTDRTQFINAAPQRKVSYVRMHDDEYSPVYAAYLLFNSIFRALSSLLLPGSQLGSFHVVIAVMRRTRHG
jgi:cell division protein FtsI/penicillin-binding protein 2